MYPVSHLFQTLMTTFSDTSSWESVYGTLSFRTTDGTVTFNFDDNAVVQGSLVIKDQLGDGKFGFGGAYIRNVSVKIDCDKIEGLNAVNINLTNAEIEIWYRLHYNHGKDYEDVYMGKFYIDSKNSSRKFQILKLIGEDCLTKFDVMSVAMSYASPYEVYATACSLAGFAPLTPEEEVDALPNGGLSLTFDTSQIQTARDMLMWVAKLTGTIARVSRQSEEIELIQIPTKYTDFNIANNFDLDAFSADNGTSIHPSSRYNTEYTDTAIRVITLVTDYKGERISEGWHFTSENPCAPNTLEGTLEIESNPLLSGKSLYEVKTALAALQDYTQRLRMSPFKVEFSGNPAIEIGDFVHLVYGGAITDAFMHYGVVTYHRWVYNGNSEIRCDYGGASQRPYYLTGEAESEVAAASTFSLSALSDETSIESVQPKSQLEKRLGSTDGNNETAKYLKTDNWILSAYDEIISFGRNKTVAENQRDRSIELKCKDDCLKISYNNAQNNVNCSINAFSDCFMVGGSDANKDNAYQGKILEIWADGSQEFTIGACRFTFSSSGMNIYNSIRKRNIYIPFTD